jgi:hypothetical protein
MHFAPASLSLALALIGCTSAAPPPYQPPTQRVYSGGLTLRGMYPVLPVPRDGIQIEDFIYGFATSILGLEQLTTGAVAVPVGRPLLELVDGWWSDCTGEVLRVPTTDRASPAKWLQGSGAHGVLEVELTHIDLGLDSNKGGKVIGGLLTLGLLKPSSTVEVSIGIRLALKRVDGNTVLASSEGWGQAPRVAVDPEEESPNHNVTALSQSVNVALYQALSQACSQFETQARRLAE